MNYEDIPVGEVRQIKFKDGDDGKKKYAESLVKKVVTVLNSTKRKSLEEKWRVAAQQAAAAIPRVDADDHECQLDMPMTPKYLIMAVSRIINAFLRYETVFVARRASNSVDEALVRSFERLSQYIVMSGNDGLSGYRKFLNSLAMEWLVFTKVIIKVSFVQKRKTINEYYHLVTPESDPELGANGAADYEGKIRKKRREIVVGESTIREVVRNSDFIYPFVMTDDIDEMPWVCHRHWRSLDYVRDMVAEGRYIKTWEGQNILERIGKPVKRRDDSMDLSINKGEYLDGASSSYRDDCEAPLEGDHDLYYEFLEIFTKIDGQEVVFVIDRESGIPLMAIYNWRDDFSRPFFTCSYNPIDNSIDGSSLAYEIEPLHRANSASVQQRIDAASFANQTMVLHDDSIGLGRYFTSSQHPRSGVYGVRTMGRKIQDTVEVLKINQPWSQLNELESVFQAWADQIAGFSPYNAGIEQINRPTAMGQQLLVSEGAQPWLNRIDNLRAFLSDILYCEIGLYRSNYPEAFEFWFANATGEDISQIIRWPADYWRHQVKIETTVSSEKLSREMKRQEWLDLVDKIQQIFSGLLEMAAIATEPGPLAPLASILIRYYTRVVLAPWLEIFGLRSEELGIAIGDSLDEGKVVQQILAAAEQASQQAEQATEQATQLESENRKLGIIIGNMSEEFARETGRSPQTLPKTSI